MLFNRDIVDKGDTSWTGPTRMSTESLPSKALSMTSGSVLSPVGDSEPLDRSISQPNIAGGSKLPAAVPPSPTILASGSSTSSDLSRGGYASADSLGSMSSKDDMLTAPLASDETQSLTTERSTRSASPCHEHTASLSITVDEQSVRSPSLSASLEPTPDLVLNLPTTSENTAVTHTLSPPLTSAEMFASAEHGTIKKSGTPGRSSASGEDGTSMDEVFPQTPVEITQALDSDSFSFELLPSPPPALTDVHEFELKSTSEEFELPPPDDLPELSLECESLLLEASSAAALHPCTDTVPSTSVTESCSTGTEVPTAVFESQMKLTSTENARPFADSSEVLSTGSLITAENDHSKLKSGHLLVGSPPEPFDSQESNIESKPVGDGSDLLKEVHTERIDVSTSAAELQSQSASSVEVVAQEPVKLSAALSSHLVQQEDVRVEDSTVPAALLPADASSSAVAAAAPDVVHPPPVTSSDTQTDSAVQSTTSASSVAELRPVPCASPRPSSSPMCAEQLMTASPPSEAVECRHSAAERRLSESSVAMSSNCQLLSTSSPQSAVSRLVMTTHSQATSVAVPKPLPHRPPPSLAAHSAALQLLSQKLEPSNVTAVAADVPVEKPEALAKLQPSPSDRPKPKPPPVKKKPSGPLKEKFFSVSGDHHPQ